MGDGFAKIYGDKLLRSTLFLEPPEARLVFLAMLAMADAEGVVDVPGVKALANVLNLEVSYVQRALAILESPDPDSRSKDHEGRRVLPLDTGWQLVNYIKYREHRTNKQEASRKRVAKHRSVTRNAVTPDAEGEAATDADTPQAPQGAGMSLRDVARIFRDVTGQVFPTDIDAQWTERDERAPARRMLAWCGGNEGKLRAKLKAMCSDDWLAKQPFDAWAKRIGGKFQQNTHQPAPTDADYNSPKGFSA